MNARKSMSLIGAAIVIGVGVSAETAFAGIDKGGSADSKTGDQDRGNKKVSRGEVTRFGSVYVNGVRYSTDTAVFLINGSLGSEADLSIGQIVTVYGEYDDTTGEGIADVVVSENPITGPISTLDPTRGQMNVLGQTVHLNSDTAWSLTNSGGLNNLGAGDVVAISGYRNADGEIVATLISDGLSDGDFDVTGSIGGVDSASTTFWIDGLSVDYGSANLFGLAGGMPATGQRVDVTGATLNASGQLVATSVAADYDDIEAGAGTAAEVEGLVTSMSAWYRFDIGGTEVRIDFNTDFVGGWFFDLAEDAKLEVEGSFDGNGVLVADTIRFQRPSNTEASGYVQSIGNGSFVIGGQRVIVSPETAWEDDSDRRFNLGAMRTGDYITVRGLSFGTGITATRVERGDDWDDDDDWDYVDDAYGYDD